MLEIKNITVSVDGKKIVKGFNLHIGKGEIGLSGFKFIMNDPRLASIPKILETEKEEDLAQDVVNLKTLRKLIGK